MLKISQLLIICSSLCLNSVGRYVYIASIDFLIMKLVTMLKNLWSFDFKGLFQKFLKKDFNPWSIFDNIAMIWPIDRVLSGTPPPGQSATNGNERILCIPQSSSITGASLSDCLWSYPRHLYGKGFLPLCRDAVGVFYGLSQLGWAFNRF